MDTIFHKCIIAEVEIGELSGHYVVSQLNETLGRKNIGESSIMCQLLNWHTECFPKKNMLLIFSKIGKHRCKPSRLKLVRNI
ncbi:hypothetical protein OSB04_016802 [Centaurea solstitialis]|uniref:Uncharacterized protein n=1 Tax=Centaurea solstitialis TaxID=347529 RepID=A0AA38W8V0_9ASTR|nr:hypothetical protein OSB04_016802 [Centaurea solstitialis]